MKYVEVFLDTGGTVYLTNVYNVVAEFDSSTGRCRRFEVSFNSGHRPEFAIAKDRIVGYVFGTVDDLIEEPAEEPAEESTETEDE